MACTAPIGAERSSEWHGQAQDEEEDKVSKAGMEFERFVEKLCECTSAWINGRLGGCWLVAGTGCQWNGMMGFLVLVQISLCPRYKNPHFHGVAAFWGASLSPGPPLQPSNHAQYMPVPCLLSSPFVPVSLGHMLGPTCQYSSKSWRLLDNHHLQLWPKQVTLGKFFSTQIYTYEKNTQFKIYRSINDPWLFGAFGSKSRLALWHHPPLLQV